MSVEVTGVEETKKKLKTLDDTLSSLRPVLLTIGNMVKNSIDLSFEEEKSPFGEKWEPLKLATKKAKQKKGLSTKILREHGDLQDKWVVDAGALSVSITNNIKSKKGYSYPLAHQYGTKHMDKRVFAPIKENGDLEPRLLKTIESYLDNKIAQALK